MITFTTLCLLTFIYVNYSIYKTKEYGENYFESILDKGYLFVLLYYISAGWLILLLLTACFIYLP